MHYFRLLTLAARSQAAGKCAAYRCLEGALRQAGQAKAELDTGAARTRTARRQRLVAAAASAAAALGVGSHEAAAEPSWLLSWSVTAAKARPAEPYAKPAGLWQRWRI